MSVTVSVGSGKLRNRHLGTRQMVAIRRVVTGNSRVPVFLVAPDKREVGSSAGAAVGGGDERGAKLAAPNYPGPLRPCLQTPLA